MQAIKVVVVGDGAVGKTSLLMNYIQKPFPIIKSKIIFNTYPIDKIIDGKVITLNLIDTTGQTEHDSIRPLAYNNPDTDVVLICFSLGSLDSFANITSRWIPEVKKYCPNVPIITHSDLGEDERKVKQQDIINLINLINLINVNGYGYEYLECACGCDCEYVSDKATIDHIFNSAYKAVLNNKI